MKGYLVTDDPNEREFVVSEELVQSQHVSASRIGEAPRDGSTSCCVVIIKSIGHCGILSAYEEFLGKGVGAEHLHKEYELLFEEAKTDSNLSGDVRIKEGEAYLAVKLASEAEAFAEALIRRTPVSNQKVVKNPSNYKSFVVGISTGQIHCSQTVATDAVIAIAEGVSLLEEAASLVSRGNGAEIRVTEAVWKALPEQRQESYESIETTGTASRQNSIRRRFVGQRGRTVTGERCVMSVDMAQFSQIQGVLEMSLGSYISGMLQGQIEDILRTGFQRVKDVSYEQAKYKFGGDGGIFTFDFPEQAHKVACEILQEADTKNKKLRSHGNHMGIRCFRVGISYGPLTTVHDERAGAVISLAVRLEAGGPSGEIRISPEAYRELPDGLKRMYGGEERIQGKTHDGVIKGRRCKVTHRAPWLEPVGGPPYPPPLPNPEFPSDELRALNENECFVISEISDDARVNAVFEKLIVPGCRAVGYTALRADKIAGSDRLDVIRGSLRKAGMCIAYFGNPAAEIKKDVLLETGFRIANELPIVMLCDAAPDGTIPDYKTLLPFHLFSHTVITIPTARGEITDAIPALIAEITASKGTKRRDDWDATNPVLTVRFSGPNDAMFTEVSKEARAVFGSDVKAGAPAAILLSVLEDRMPQGQLDAFRREMRAHVREIIGHNAVREPGVQFKMPLARVPIVFYEDIDPVKQRPCRGYLPIIARYTTEGQFVTLRMFYLVISESIKKENDCYVCDL
jgi:class 3 adenylate cyclase